MMKGISRGRGRPCKDGSRRKTFKIRLNDDECNLLHNLSEKTGYSMSDILRKALRMYCGLDRLR